MFKYTMNEEELMQKYNKNQYKGRFGILYCYSPIKRLPSLHLGSKKKKF